jgi:sugar phosphate permease
MTLGRILGIFALPLALFAVAIGVVLMLRGSSGSGYGFAAFGVALAGLAVWMLVTGRPESTGLTPSGRRPGADLSGLPDLR